MHPIIRNILAVVAGIFVGGAVNMGLIAFGGMVVPVPEGVIPGDMDSLIANIDKFGVIDFMVPFFAHALGTLAGAMLAAKVAATHHLAFAFTIGVFFLMGGIYMVSLLPAPLWFEVTDLTLAYLPMGWLGWFIADKLTNKGEVQ